MPALFSFLISLIGELFERVLNRFERPSKGTQIEKTPDDDARQTRIENAIHDRPSDPLFPPRSG